MKLGRLIGVTVSLVIGGTVYTFSQSDIARNLAADTGMTQERAEQFVDNINQGDLVAFDELGNSYLDTANKFSPKPPIDCSNFTYKWETETLTCEQGKSQLQELKKRHTVLGNAYVKLSQKSATDADTAATIRGIDSLYAAFDFEILQSFIKLEEINKLKMDLSYNKAVLNAALESSH